MSGRGKKENIQLSPKLYRRNPVANLQGLQRRSLRLRQSGAPSRAEMLIEASAPQRVVNQPPMPLAALQQVANQPPLTQAALQSEANQPPLSEAALQQVANQSPAAIQAVVGEPTLPLVQVRPMANQPPFPPTGTDSRSPFADKKTMKRNAKKLQQAMKELKNTRTDLNKMKQNFQQFSHAAPSSVPLSQPPYFTQPYYGQHPQMQYRLPQIPPPWYGMAPLQPYPHMPPYQENPNYNYSPFYHR